MSVVVPAYNVRTYIQDALTSLERQSMPAFEVLVVDDGATDGTQELVTSFCERDQRFKLLHKENGGLSSARNYGMRHARAPYIALLDGDDRYEPDKLATHVAVLDSHPAVGVVYSSSRVIRDDGKPTFMHLSGKPIDPDPLVALLYKNFIGHGSNAVFRSSLRQEVGEFDENLKSSEDLDFWIRIALLNRWRFYREPRLLCGYRVRPSGLSFNVLQMERCTQKVLELAYRRAPERVGPFLPTARAYLYRYLARVSLASGDMVEAQRWLDRAWEEDASIFRKDAPSFVTLMAVYLAPLSRPTVGWMLK
ncbi:MAG: glycosyltransferase family 2 protein [Gloeobacterales cyanobacterium]